MLALHRFSASLYYFLTFCIPAKCGLPQGSVLACRFLLACQPVLTGEERWLFSLLNFAMATRTWLLSLRTWILSRTGEPPSEYTLDIFNRMSQVPQNKDLQNWTNIRPDLLLWLTAHFPPWPHPAPDAHTRGLDGPLFWLSQLLFYQLLTPVTSPSLNLMGTLCLFCSHLDPLSLHNFSSSSLSVSPCFNLILCWQLNHPRPYLWLWVCVIFLNKLLNDY